MKTRREIQESRNREIARNNNRYSSAVRYVIAGDHSIVDAAQILYYQDNKCVYCKVELIESGTLDHIISQIKGGTHNADNIQFLCRVCNSTKGALNHEEYIEYMRIRDSLGKKSADDYRCKCYSIAPIGNFVKDCQSRTTFNFLKSELIPCNEAGGRVCKMRHSENTGSCYIGEQQSHLNSI